MTKQISKVRKWIKQQSAATPHEADGGLSADTSPKEITQYARPCSELRNNSFTFEAEFNFSYTDKAQPSK
jgi:hypothetical protein